MQLILGRTWLEWIRLSRIFRAPFAHLSLEIVKKMSRYYLLSGLSRIFRKPFANVYISRKVPFAQTFQIYACGPRLCKTFHGFLHDSQMFFNPMPFAKSMLFLRLVNFQCKFHARKHHIGKNFVEQTNTRYGSVVSRHPGVPILVTS